MQLNTREEEYCKLEAHCVMDLETIQKKREEIVENIMSQKPHIAGYRPGKAPYRVIRHKFRQLIDKNLKESLLAEAHDNVIYETKIKPIGTPAVKAVELHEDEFWCELLFLKKPEFELKEYKGLEIPKPHTEVNADARIEEEMQRLREQQGDMAPYSDTDVIEMKDKVTMDIKLTIDDQVDNREGTLYIIGSNAYPELDQHLLGLKAGEEAKFTVKFPETAAEIYRGKEGTFEVKIHMGMKVIPCPLDDSLAERVGYKTYDELRTAISGMISNQMENQTRQELGNQIAKRLVSTHDFEIPDWLRDAEARNMCEQMGTKLEKMPAEAKETILNQAKDNVKYSLILDSIKEKEADINYSEGELVNILRNKLVEMGQKDPDKSIREFQKTDELYKIITNIRQQLVVEWLINNAKQVE